LYATWYFGGTLSEEDTFGAAPGGRTPTARYTSSRLVRALFR
jgi:hypothetical protein